MTSASATSALAMHGIHNAVASRHLEHGLVVDNAGNCASKGALRMLSDSVALYCARKGYPIRCNAVHPTYVGSEMLDPIATLCGSHEAMVQAMSRLGPVGRLAKPADAAAAVVCLASDAAGIVTGTELVVAGMQTAGIAPSHFA